MDVLVDSTVWSLALRRRRTALSEHEARLAREWDELLTEGRMAIIGMIRQEVLSGIAIDTEYDRLRRVLRRFDDLPVTSEDHERAAAFYNTCRARGIQGSHTDFLMCAIAEKFDLTIFTTDSDFSRYAAHLPIRLHGVRPEFS
ncbi:MAG: PIN domain-containing protein [Dehalococcoidia bacterium]